MQLIGIIGAGGQAKVVVDIYRSVKRNSQLVVFTTSPEAADPYFTGCILEPDTDDARTRYAASLIGWHVAIGNPHIRRGKTDWLERISCPLLSAVHDKSVLASSSTLGLGSSMMAGAIVNPDSVIGRGCIVNSAAVVEHDCRIGDFVNVGPGCRIAGGVSVGGMSELGAGVVVIPGIRIGRGCVIGAGAVVTRDIPDYSKAVGVPARIIGSVPPKA